METESLWTESSVSEYASPRFDAVLFLHVDHTQEKGVHRIMSDTYGVQGVSVAPRRLDSSIITSVLERGHTIDFDNPNKVQLWQIISIFHI